MFSAFKSIRIRHRDHALLFGPAVLYLVVSAILWWFLGGLGLMISMVLLLLVVLSAQFHFYRRTEEDLEQHLRQTQALNTLFALLPIRAPLAPLAGWAATPEFATILVDIIRDRRPKSVVELGSGTSSVIIAYALELNGDGRLISFDHDASFAAHTRNELRKHGLGNRVRVHHAPLTPHQFENTSWSWYSIDPEQIPKDIDLLIVDGPPHESGPHARYPGMVALHANLSADPTIVLDDASRKEESEIARRWVDRYPDFSLSFVDSPKGTAILRRTHIPDEVADTTENS